MSRTGLALTEFVAGIRRLSFVAWGGVGLGAACLGLGLAAWGARLGLFTAPWWVLATWGLVVGVSGVLVVLGTRGVSRLSAGWLAAQFESMGFRRGALSGHLEPAAAGTSTALLSLADTRQAEELRAKAPAFLRQVLSPFRRHATQGAMALLAGAVVLGSANPTHGRAARLWRPTEAWEATIAPLTVTLTASEVERGGQIEVRATARGRQHAILWVRAPGESWRGRGLTLDSAGQAATMLGPIETDLFVRLQSGGRSSDTVQIKVRIPAFLGTLALVARYPRYLGLEDEPVPIHGDTVVIPEGTRLETEGEATTSLSAATWTPGSGGSEKLRVDGAGFRGVFVPRGSQVWTLSLQTASGVPLAGDTVRVPIMVVLDSAPRVDLPVPGADTVVPLSLRVPLVIDAQDDHGLTRLVVESRRISRLGFEDPARSESVQLPETGRDRVMLPYELDLNQRGLLPGDSVRFFVRASDNAPVPHVTTSREFLLRLPTLSEVREAAREAAGQVSHRLDSLSQASRKLERQTEDLAQQRPRTAAETGGSTDESLRFEDAKRAENVAESQQALVKQLEQVKEALEALRKSAEAAGLTDPAWQERLQQIQSELERALTPELRQRLAELQQALKDLDPERAREALERLAEAQQELREALERSKDLFKRAAIEGDLANLTAEAKDLALQQKQWTQQVPALDSARASREEQALAARADSLGGALEKLSAELNAEALERQSAMEQSAARAQQAAAQMRQAARSASQGKTPEAKQQGRQASEQLDPLGEELKGQREQLQQEWRKEVVNALDRALGDASRLAERQLDVAQSLSRGEASAELRAEQGAIEEGVERLLDQVKEIGGKNALVSQQSSVALATGRDNMRRAREALATAAPNVREATRRSEEAVDAMNAAAYTLLRSRGAVQGAETGSGLQEAMEQMAQMAKQQGQVGQQAGGMLPQMGQGGAMMQEQLRALGQQQRAIAERMERMRAGGQIPGAADMAQEAKELARSMEAGRLDRQTVERQERLFRRMLDAGRTLQGEEQDEKQERQSTTARDDSIHLPPALRARLDGGENGLRFPTWEDLQQLSPEERRRVVEYFRRLSESAKAPK
jgi:hypothetical protein